MVPREAGLGPRRPDYCPAPRVGVLPGHWRARRLLPGARERYILGKLQPVVLVTSSLLPVTIPQCSRNAFFLNMQIFFLLLHLLVHSSSQICSAVHRTLSFSPFRVALYFKQRLDKMFSLTYLISVCRILKSCHHSIHGTTLEGTECVWCSPHTEHK